jgi:ABC-type multidrug transport system ATPase subunit
MPIIAQEAKGMNLEIKSLTKAFDKKTILNNFSYCFNEKGLYILRGESGIGKTTLLRIIAGLDANYSGEVVGGGVHLVSFAFQEHRLFPSISAIENVVVAISNGKSKADYDRALNLLRLLGLNDDDVKLYPHELSGGMKQRVSLARAILMDAPILLLDEPTKELDSANADTVRKLIIEESKRRLVIMVSHNNEDLTALGATEINLAVFS